MTLLRSVLRARTSAFEWPPPDAEAWPDAVLLEPDADDRAFEEAVQALDHGRVELMLLGNPTPETIRDVTSVAVEARAPDDLEVLAELLDALEGMGGVPSGAVGIDVLITDARGSLNARGLAASHARVRALVADPETLGASLRVPASTEVDALAYPRGEVLLGALTHGRIPVGRFLPSGHHRATAGGRTPSQFSFALGFRGGLCSVWDDVREANRGYVPDAEQRERCSRILEAMREATAQGLGAVSLDGRMIDLPFVAMAEGMVAIARAADARDAEVARLLGEGA